MSSAVILWFMNCPNLIVGKKSRFLFDMLDAGISPNVYTYSALIDSLCKEEKTQEAESLFRLMTKKGVQPDVVTFNSLISFWCKSG